MFLALGRIVCSIIFAAGITSIICVVPEASQEGPLLSFKNYGDIVMFHYNVPKEVLRATWQFAAFMDDEKCPIRKVNIYLQWGSYPVISADNASFPANMYYARNHTIQASTFTSFDPRQMTVVPVYSPQPGDWFVGAYLSHWDEKVQQKGLTHKCRYSIGSVAVWSQTSGIQNIPLNYQQTFRTKEMISYYKIYIPVNTWHFRIDIWGCNYTLKSSQNNQEPCISSLALQGRALPIYNHSNPSPIGNLSSSDQYTFYESAPYEDSYYYLMVVTNSAVDFDIKVTVNDCPVRITERTFVRQYVDAPFFSKALAQLHLKDLKKPSLEWYSINISETQNLFSYSKGHGLPENNDYMDTCVPRYQLARIKHAQTFSGSYLLQGREWLTSWVALTDSYPVIIQFDILPLVDIGGTLDINVKLEMEKTINDQEARVFICVRQARVPHRIKGKIICDNEKLTMELSSQKKKESNILIPYPQPDTWYVALQASCHYRGYPAHCAMEEILVSLEIKLRPCVFSGSNSCGQYGVCQEIRKGILYYTSCNCFNGRKGWGCTDGSSADSQSSILTKTFVLTFSNLFFFPAVYLSLKRKLYTESLVYFATMMFSALYHACDQQIDTYCITKFEVLQYCDFYSSILAFWVTLIAIADVPSQYISCCHMFGAISIAYGVESDRTGLSSLLPLAIGILITPSTYVYRCIVKKTVIWPARLFKLVIGSLLAGFGVFIFSLVETESNYQYVHSLWHIIIALSLLFLLPQKKIEKVYSDQSTDKLLEYKDDPSTLSFSIENS